jgi:hypothetical protein
MVCDPIPRVQTTASRLQLSASDAVGEATT